MLKILQARIQQHVNQELPDFQAGFRKGRGIRDQIANICWIIEKGKAREFQKNIYFFFVDFAKTFDCVDHNKLWKILKEMGILDHLTCLLRNLYAVQEATVQLLSRIRLFATSWTAAQQASLYITNSRSLFNLMSIESVMPSNPLILCHPLLLLPSFFPSIRVFSNESVRHIRWPKYWSFSFSISPSNEYSGLISFGMDWFDLLAVQGTLRSLLQHHSSKASISQCSAFFIVQLSHPYMTIGKSIALTRWTSVGKVTSLLLNMLCRLVIAFLPRNQHLLICWP